MVEMPVVNDGLILASGGGNISINFGDPFEDNGINGADGKICVINGGTLQLGGNFINDGLISAVNSTVDFGDGTTTAAQNEGDIFISGGALSLGSSLFGFQPVQWTDSGAITTIEAAVQVQGSGIISAGGTLTVLGGSVSGPANIEDAGKIRLGGASVTLSSLSIDAGGELSGFGTITDPIANSGTVAASLGEIGTCGANHRGRTTSHRCGGDSRAWRYDGGSDDVRGPTQQASFGHREQFLREQLPGW